MTSVTSVTYNLVDLKNQAKSIGLEGFSTMRRDELEALLRGETVVRYKLKHLHIGTHTDLKYQTVKDVCIKRIYED